MLISEIDKGNQNKNIPRSGQLLSYLKKVKKYFFPQKINRLIDVLK
jgi:hypothetical protein